MRPAPFSFVARAVLEPPVFDDTARPPVIVRLVGGGGSFTNDPYGTVAAPARSPRAFARICGYGAFS